MDYKKDLSMQDDNEENDVVPKEPFFSPDCLEGALDSDWRSLCLGCGEKNLFRCWRAQFSGLSLEYFLSWPLFQLVRGGRDLTTQKNCSTNRTDYEMAASREFVARVV